MITLDTAKIGSVKKKLTQGVDKATVLAKDAADFATNSKAQAKLAHKVSKKTNAVVKVASATAASALAKGKTGTPSSSSLAKVSLWSGLSSLVIGFPANVVSIVAGVAVEDRNRQLRKGLLTKAALKTVGLTAKQLKGSRIGLAAGAVSLTVGVLALTIHSVKVNRAVRAAREAELAEAEIEAE